jgi:arylsulfatase A
MLAAALVCVLAGSVIGAETPNILLVLVDDMGYGDSRVYNPESQVPMPNLEALAARGMVFTDAHSAAGTCAPSRYSVLTGNYPWRGRKPGGTWRYNEPCQILDHQETIGTLLKKAGYHTAIFGKLHQGGHFRSLVAPDVLVHDRLENDHEVIDFTRRFLRGPLEYGFDSSFVLPNGIQGEPYAAFEDDKLAGDPARLKIWRPGQYGLSVIPKAGVGLSSYDSSQVGPHLTQKAIDFIGSHLQANRRSGNDCPFFVHYCSQVLHGPTTPPESFAGHTIRGATFSHATDMFVELDVTLGLFVAALRKHGALADTLIIVTSDNGGWFYDAYLEHNHATNGALKGSKGTVWEGGHRVPFIAAWGDGTQAGSSIRPGSRNHQLIAGQDLYATFAELIGQPTEPDQGLDSLSFLPTLLGEETASRRDHLVVQASQRGLTQVRKGQSLPRRGRAQQYKALRVGRWKLIVNATSGSPEGLYDLGSDPREQENLIADPASGGRVTTMMQRYEEILSSERSTPAYAP